MSMRIYSWLLVLALASQVAAQAPRIGSIETYGYEKLNPDRLVRLAGVRLGDPLPPSKSEVEQKIEASNDVVRAHVEGYCCQGDNVVLYLGVLEAGARPFSLHSPPAEDLQLPVKLDLVYQRLLRNLEAAHERGVTGETYDRGYPLSADPGARRAQETLVLLVDPFVTELGEVLRRAADEEVRAAAVYILAYARDRRAAEGHFQYALRDFSPDVRQNALRSLDLVRRYPGSAANAIAEISPTWLIEMLQSVTWADRQEAARLLVRLTEKRPEGVLASIEERALTALGQMAVWKTPEHAEAAYVLLGRVAGLQEEEILASFREGKRELVLDAIRKRAQEKRRFLFF
ncbi:MAG: HEAT repeat domain-containing protein [Bryobacterales bacterium]|nr:HEAT repeat domain-containing protein [Bryobacterales bacterium]